MMALTLMNSVIAGNSPRMIEVSDGTQTYTGMVVARSPQDCFIVDKFGCQIQLPINSLKSFEVVAEKFRPASQSQFRRMLEAELGSGYEVATSKHYVVCGERGRSRNHAALFENYYNEIVSFYSIRGFQTSDPETPLVAIVLRNQEDFKKYCEQDQVAWNKGLRGYYLRSTNRVALYDTPELLKSARLTPDAGQQMIENTLMAAMGSSGSDPHAFGASFVSLQSGSPASTVSGETADTIIHETTHQVGFNIGIHNRIAETPSWTLEGLATVLESPGLRDHRRSGSTVDKINSERLEWFRREYAQRRQPGDLAKLIASDEMFRTQTLDAYSAAWGITWFLSENPARARLFAKYLRTVSERDPVLPYTPEARLEDFQSAFGDISRLEVDYVRALDRL